METTGETPEGLCLLPALAPLADKTTCHSLDGMRNKKYLYAVEK
jgi:hypothetical protein